MKQKLRLNHARLQGCKTGILNFNGSFGAQG